MQKYPPVVKGFPHMLHGADYNPEQWRETKEIWREDMRLAKLANMNSLSVGIFAWAALEPEEGRYDFAWLDEVMGMMEEGGMKAVLATPSGARPPWLAQKYPEVLRVDADRQKRLFGGRHNHCFTSPAYREKVRAINTKLAERYKDHPALGVWHLSNEYSGECHCELCREAFRAWLRARYGSLADLNRAWWSAFWSHTCTDWGQVEPPSPKGEYETNGLMLDWRRFVTHQTVDFMKAEMEPLRRITPGVPCTTNMMGFFEGLDYYRMARELDVVSWDSYPVWRGDGGDAAVALRASFAHDMFRSLMDGRPFMLMESTPSVVNWQPVNKLRRPGMAALQGLQAVAHGSDTVQYFQFRKSRGGSEKFHGAVVDHEGSENTRVFKEVAATGGMLSKLDAVVGTARPAEVAIIYDVENSWALREAKGYRQDGNGYLEALLGHYAPLWKAGVTVDIADSTKDLSKYKLVIAPMLYMLRPGMAEKLHDFVRAGGTLVCTYMTGVADERDLCFLGGFPGPLKDLLGVWCEETDCLYDGASREIAWRGNTYLAHDFCEIAHLRGARAEGEYLEDFYAGFPAVTANSFGNGKAYYVAARMGADFQEAFLGGLIRELGLKTALGAPLPEGCTAQARADGENEYVFVMNFMPEANGIDVGEGGISLLTGETVRGVVELPARGVEIFTRKT